MRVRTPEDLYSVINVMREEGLSEMHLSELSLTAEQIQEVIFDYVGVVQYRYRLGDAWMEIEWYPGHRIWFAMRSGAMDSLSARDQEIARRAQAVVDSVIAPGMTDLQKETALHDYIIYHADYLRDESQDTDSVYGFFERGWIQCSGYVDTFFLLGRMAGLEVTGVSGFVLEDGEAHSWNLVRLDGMWYAVDVTWDDPIGGGHEAHTYLNIPHRCFDGLRTWDPRTLPGGAYAQSLDANWYYAGVPVLWDLDAAVSAASMQIDQTGEALLILEGGLQSDDVARQLANRYQRTIWTGNLLEQSWARMYSFSFKQ